MLTRRMERHEPHQPPAETGALAGIRVFDVSRSVAGAWCSRLLADLGADVYAGEPAAGHPLRALAVVPGGRSPIAEYLLANKRSAPVDLDSLTGVEAFTALAAGFDVVLSSFTAAKLTALGRAAAFERLAEGGAIVAHLTPHGLSGPLSTVAGNELTTAAWSGWASINGIAGREPLKPSGWQSSYCTGTAAATAIIAALLHRRRTGEALTVDIAAIEVMAAAFARRHSARTTTESRSRGRPARTSQTVPSRWRTGTLR
jgi:crotonobetainyl-CoA:carnitine CoA-transferase CaiB-like acyl-CoA transferase